jgi:hypothetical protein
MPTRKQGQKELRTVLDENGEVYTTLLKWAQKRHLTPGKAVGCIIADWSDAINGEVNPFAVAIAAAAGVNLAVSPHTMSQTATEEPLVSPEEQKRKAALLEAAEQFL